ncbi:MAG: TIGR04282 family arsenosugar biosynthesis glycosyltransferase [Saprospiraceae bacterium]|nr:TIGR04282 family arsenosugar biosynthesis glycosyltransferase [Candidatus Defluviibacterium haderslevense]MBK7244282.1 TIGR04282 family arsenosugar biosynthesis glycosyltransferase [Candidatus Defluviibacterium haderslevense]
MNPNALIIFIRNPFLGKVKTRLAHSLGAEQALTIYTKLLKITREQSILVNAQCYLYYSDHIEQDAWSENTFIKRVQFGEDLGARMANAFNEVLQTHSKAIIIGSDCPYITGQIIDHSFHLLSNNDVILGPAKDGGYYLLGMKSTSPSLFVSMPWSETNLYEKTIEKLNQLNYTYTSLIKMEDIDTEEEWNRYVQTQGK